MLKIDNGDITLTRGDSANITVMLTAADGVTPYAPATGDIVTLTVKRTVYDAQPLLTLDCTGGSAEIAPADTASWDYGDYVYDIQLTTASGGVCTVVTPHRLTIAPEVSW